MRAVIAYHLVSLDGVAESPETFVEPWDDVMDANLAATIATQDTVILGRRSYDEWARFWPTSDVEPFATFINGVQKFIATSSPLDADWHNSSRIEGDLSEFVSELKAQSGGEIGIHSSLSVTQALLAAELVDEIKLVIAPVVVGRGRRLFEDVPRHQLELVSSAASPSGHLLVAYRVLLESAFR